MYVYIRGAQVLCRRIQTPEIVRSENTVVWKQYTYTTSKASTLFQFSRFLNGTCLPHSFVLWRSLYNYNESRIMKAKCDLMGIVNLISSRKNFKSIISQVSFTIRLNHIRVLKWFVQFKKKYIITIALTNVSKRTDVLHAREFIFYTIVYGSEQIDFVFTFHSIATHGKHCSLQSYFPRNFLAFITCRLQSRTIIITFIAAATTRTWWIVHS